MPRVKKPEVHVHDLSPAVAGRDRMAPERTRNVSSGR
jgi:hypothetical protein